MLLIPITSPLPRAKGLLRMEKLCGYPAHESLRKVPLRSTPIVEYVSSHLSGHRATEVDDGDTYTLAPTRTVEETRIGHAPSRSHSFSAAATNASMRLRKLPTVDRILPHATAAMTSAFSMGPAKRARSFSVVSNTPHKPVPIPDMPYLSYQPTLGRNSQFVDLTDEQRDELGGIEYRSLKLLYRVLTGRR